MMKHISIVVTIIAIILISSGKICSSLFIKQHAENTLLQTKSLPCITEIIRQNFETGQTILVSMTGDSNHNDFFHFLFSETDWAVIISNPSVDNLQVQLEFEAQIYGYIIFVTGKVNIYIYIHFF